MKRPRQNTFTPVFKRILGNDIAVGETAERLGVARQLLGRYLSGKDRPTRHQIDSKNWRQAFETYYSKRWKRYQTEFESEYLSLNITGNVPPTVFLEPEENGFGRVLWQIIRTGPELNDEEIAAKLNSSVEQLKRLINGSSVPSRRIIQRERYRELLKEHFPEGWSLYETDFDSAVGKLKLSLHSRGAAEPGDPDGFAHLLWALTGASEPGASTLAGERLGIGKVHFCNLIHQKEKPTLETIEKYKWREVFARDYPEPWQLLKGKFEELVATIEPRRQKQIPARAKAASERSLKTPEAWRKTAGNILKRIRTSRSDDIVDITPAMKDQQVAKNYDKLEKGAQDLPQELFDRAVAEIQQVYNLHPQDPDFAALKSVLGMDNG